MKQRHKGPDRLYCISVLHMIGADRDQDFHTLTSAQVERLLNEADRVKYQRPTSANGSRARYFFERISRGANRKEA